MRTITTKDETQLHSNRSEGHERLTPDNAALLLIDHQSGLVSGVRDLEPDEVRHNVVAFARVARIFRVPVVLTSTAPMMWGPILPELTEALPGVENIERSLVNAWDEARVRNAIKRTGRHQLLIAGITTPVCLTSAADRFFHCGGDSFGVGGVRLNRDCLSAVAFNLLNYGCGCISTFRICDGDLGPVCGQTFGDGGADTARAAGNKRNFPFQFPNSGLSPVFEV